jgi:hypothetical protein
MGQLLPSKGPEGMGIRHHEQETGPPSKLGFFITFAGWQKRIVHRYSKGTEQRLSLSPSKRHLVQAQGQGRMPFKSRY